MIGSAEPVSKWANCKRGMCVNLPASIPFPSDSALYQDLARADFADAYRTPLRDRTATPVEIFLQATRATPEWVNTLMALRNVVARAIGIKDVGIMGANASRPADSYASGDRLGIFTVIESGAHELLLGIDDSHLDVRVSVLKSDAADGPTCTISTLVRIKNLLGHLYMLPVGRIHPHVVRAMMRRGLA
ncbi:MAG: DUF2867 domain-containing protein [Sphingomonas sp.]